MKKFLLGIIVSAALFIPASVFAATRYVGLPDANDIYQFNCQSGYNEGHQCNRVAVFDDQNNKCYITYDARGAQSSISCVKGN